MDYMYVCGRLDDLGSGEFLLIPRSAEISGLGIL